MSVYRVCGRTGDLITKRLIAFKTTPIGIAKCILTQLPYNYQYGWHSLQAETQMAAFSNARLESIWK